jgi:predicted nucleic acid-binding protein
MGSKSGKLTVQKMVILDTSIWIEHLKNNPNYFPKISKLLESMEVLAVECVFGELLQGIKNNREKEIVINFWRHLPKEHYENIIIEAGEYSAKNKLFDHGVGLIDSIILMHGIKSNSKIWTMDSNFLKVTPEELIYNG